MEEQERSPTPAGLGDLGLPPRGEERYTPVPKRARQGEAVAQRQPESDAEAPAAPALTFAPAPTEEEQRHDLAEQLCTLLATERARLGAARTLTSGELYALARWRELCDDDAPWWTRSDGIGLRLRLLELLNLADARREGALKERPIAELISAGEKELGRNTGLLYTRYRKWAQAMQQALKAKPDSWHPAGQAHALAESTLELLEDPQYFTAMFDLLQKRAAELDGADLIALDEQVELLDAELALEGHSSAWRLRVIERAERFMQDGEGLARALEQATLQLRRGDLRSMQVLFRLKNEEPAVEAQSTVRLPFQTGDALSQTIAAWDADLSEEASFEHGAIVLQLQDAADPTAAALRAERWLARLMAQWSLVHDPIALDPSVWVYDPEGRRVLTFPRAAPLRLMPEGLARHQAQLSSEARREANRRRSRASLRATGAPEESAAPLADALMQLAQARTGTPGSALTDLWMVAEALFAGVAAEPKHHAADVIAASLQARYVRDALRWLADELEQTAGNSAEGTDSRAMWVLSQLHDDPSGVRARLASRPLALARTLRWECWLEGAALQEDLKSRKERWTAVADRAYLVRNFFVHAAQPERAAALDATLLPFAGMVRAAVGLVASDPRPPLISSQSAGLQAEQLAHDLASGELARADALAAFELSVDLKDP